LLGWWRRPVGPGFGSEGGDGEEPTVWSSVEADPAAASSWAADPAMEAPPELGREWLAAAEGWGQVEEVVRKGGEGGRGRR
jgi:hypothetical protein